MSLTWKFVRESRRYLEHLREQIWAWTPLVSQAVRATLAPESNLIGTSIGYYTLFSLFPLTLLVVAIASLWVDPLLAESEIVQRMEFVAPALGELLGANLERIVAARGSVTSFATLMLLWSGSNIFNVLTQAIDKIWGADIEQRGAVWRHRGLGILMVLGFTAVVLVALLAEGVLLTIWSSMLPPEMDGLRPLTNRLWAVSVSVAVFGLLYYFLPHVKFVWREVLPGAILAGLLWDGAKRLFLAFVGTYLSRSNLVYGSVAAITAFMTWAYLSSIIFLFGGHLNVLYYRHVRRVEAAEM